MKPLLHFTLLLLLPLAAFGANFRYYRFTPTELRNTAGANSVQLAEFELYANNTLLLGAIASNPGGNNPGNESPAQAVDGDLGTKWLGLFQIFRPNSRLWNTGFFRRLPICDRQ